MGLGRAIGQEIAGIGDEDPLVKKMHIKMSGCPNGCGQHHIADIGFHGAVMKAPGGQVPAYELFLGGSYDEGDARFGQRIRARVPAKRVPEAVGAVIGYYKDNRDDGEEFKDFVLRMGKKNFEPIFQGFKETRELDRESLPAYMDWDKTAKYMLERGEGECAI